jgi:predicted  nucleic acid-binding Zn-ribbon protein
MPRRKKPENETPEQAKLRLQFESIANHANRSEKTAWKRKLKNMEGLLEKLHPIEEKILTIIADEKQPLLDEIAELRTVMVKECVHPYEHLVKTEEGFVECKFCGKRLKVPDASS